MISFKAMEEIETCVDDLMDDCKDNINYMKIVLRLLNANFLNRMMIVIKYH